MTRMKERCLTYISPLLDLDFGDVLDGDLEPVPVSHPRVHDTKATLAKDRAHLSSDIQSVDVNLLYFVADSPCRASQTVLLRGETC